MKKLVYLFVSLFLIVVAAENVSAQYNKSVETNATANIITPINITKSKDLSFGNIIASGTAGTVTVDLANGRTQTLGATFPTVSGTVSSAEFTVTGFTGSAYSITLPMNDAIELSGAGTAMKLTGFNHNATEVLTSGTETFQVGAILKVNADQTAGEYTSTFNVTVNYN